MKLPIWLFFTLLLIGGMIGCLSYQTGRVADAIAAHH